jgi:hypothetical protein
MYVYIYIYTLYIHTRCSEGILTAVTRYRSMDAVAISLQTWQFGYQGLPSVNDRTTVQPSDVHSLEQRTGIALYSIGTPKRGGGAAAPPKAKLKKKMFCRHDDIRGLSDLLFSLDQLLKAADDVHWNIEIYNKNLRICSNVFIFSFNFPYNLTGYRLGDFAMSFIT